MKAICRSLFRPVITVLLAASVLAPAFALEGAGDARVPAAPAVVESGMPDSGVQFAQAGGCYAKAQRIAAESGGKIHTAEQQMRDGRMVCVIVVLVPAKDGNIGHTLREEVPLD